MFFLGADGKCIITYKLCKERMVFTKKLRKMNIDHTHKTLTLLGHFSKSPVKSMTYKCVTIEWE